MGRFVFPRCLVIIEKLFLFSLAFLSLEKYQFKFFATRIIFELFSAVSVIFTICIHTTHKDETVWVIWLLFQSLYPLSSHYLTYTLYQLPLRQAVSNHRSHIASAFLALYPNAKGQFPYRKRQLQMEENSRKEIYGDNLMSSALSLPMCCLTYNNNPLIISVSSMKIWILPALSNLIHQSI